jgi:hypothetical protein
MVGRALWRLELWWDGLSNRERDLTAVGVLAAIAGLCLLTAAMGKD